MAAAEAADHRVLRAGPDVQHGVVFRFAGGGGCRRRRPLGLRCPGLERRGTAKAAGGGRMRATSDSDGLQRETRMGCNERIGGAATRDSEGLRRILQNSSREKG